MIAEKEINTGRQIEFDYLKGLFIPMILLIHSFQIMGGTLVPAYKTAYILGTMTGSAIFLFVLGLGSTYSRRTNSQLVRDGLKLLLYELIWNVLAIGLPMVIGQGVRGLFGMETVWAVVRQRLPVMIGYINIFFIAGVSYLLLGLLRQLKTPTWIYFTLALLLIVLNPYLYMDGKTTGYAVADYVLTMFAGGRPEVSLCFLAHLPYVLFGVGFGRVLRRTTNKARLYRVIAVPAVIVAAAYAWHALSVNDGLDALYAYSGNGYLYPDTIRALANCSCVLLMSGLFYALRNQITAIKPFHAALVHLSKKTTPYYAVHPFWYGLTASLVCFAPRSAAFCLLMTPVVWALCYITIRFWEWFCVCKR
jgi:arginine exporter protein ArgO